MLDQRRKTSNKLSSTGESARTSNRQEQRPDTGWPNISLPKGGGAIRGIDEKISVNSLTGTASLSVPLPATPSRSGFFPRLSINYDSGTGNSPFGLGWQLSIPAIYRKTARGLPKYRDAENSDTFILSGAEDLVPVPGGADPPDGATVQRFRPRVEGMFALIERWTDNVSHETHWRSISKENVTDIYGRSSSARIFNPADHTQVFQWLLEESYDDKGNVILYSYKEEDDLNVDKTRPQERNRTSFSNRYLKRIYYGNHTPRKTAPSPPSSDFHFEIVFDYGEHDPDEPTPQGTSPWPCRLDPFSTYRAGFEVRTYRLCRRVLLFHHFPDEAELAGFPLVRSTAFTHEENEVASFIKFLTQTGFMHRAGEATYRKKPIPPLEFTYTQPVISDEIKTVDAESLANLPVGLDGLRYRWIDLDNEGLSGLLTEQARAWFYKRNLGNAKLAPDIPIPKLGPLELLNERPSLADLMGGRTQLMNMVGAGRLDLVQFAPPLSGFYQRDDDGRWLAFRPFAAKPNIDWQDPNLRFIDLTGDGSPDLLLTEDEVFLWYPAQAANGFGAAHWVRKLHNEEKGPALVFADSTQSIFLADMSGDGLTDLVRIRNGEVCYWPNQGYGRFGAKVTMDHAPFFDLPEQFHHNRLRLADVDGSGTTDIIYLGRDAVRFWFNQAGNSLSPPHQLKTFPHVDHLTSVTVVDLLGNGTACLVWSSALPADAPQPMRYVDLMSGQKPHLLRTVTNNVGAETRLQYAASTKFYLEDRAAGVPWVTKLPFPLHVVEKVESLDHVTKTAFVKTYHYRHGFYDMEEREFRGFGRVDQLDTETFEHFVRRPADNVVEEPLHQPPMLTKSWFHTGAFFKQARILDQFAHEYYQNTDLTECTLPEPVLPANLNGEEYREAVRACRGLALRQEVYALDNSSLQQHPYHVTQHTCQIHLLQTKSGNAHAVFLVTAAESISYHYERHPADPRITHNLTLATDPLGNVTKSASVIYPRRTVNSSLPSRTRAEQARLHITYAETDFTNDVIETLPVPAHRLRVPSETRSFEITGKLPDDGNFFTAEELRIAIAAAVPIAFDVEPDGTPQKRVLAKSRTLYLKNDLSGPLPPSRIASLGLIYQSYQLALTPELVTRYYQTKVDAPLLQQAGYTHSEGDLNWWIPSATSIFPANPADHFYLPSGVRDPFGTPSHTRYDDYHLLVEETSDILNNVTTAENDYRVMQPRLVTDPNLNRTAIEFDELGMVVKSAALGKAGAVEGDTLADPSARMEYSLFNWKDNNEPNFVHTFKREKHGAANPRWQESYVYSDGSGNVIMTKAQAEPGRAKQLDASGHVIEVDTTPNVRWIGNGRTVLNNKGNPVKQYEPYFSVTHEYESARALVETGVTPILFYDPLGRLIKTQLPNGTFTKVELDAWHLNSFDLNDTVLESLWYVERGSPDPDGPEPTDPETRAAWLAAKHADTPSAVHLDSLGRAICGISDNGAKGQYLVRTEKDLTGHKTLIFDPKNRKVAEAVNNMVGMPMWAFNAEKGHRWLFHNVLGNPVRMWDGEQRKFRIEYDALHRPLSSFYQEGAGDEKLFSHHVFGETHPTAASLNLRGKLYKSFDQAGVLTFEGFDFKGNPQLIKRRFARSYNATLDWTSLHGLTTLAQINTAAEPLLVVGEEFTSSINSDALSRPQEITLPDQSELRPLYTEGNLLKSLRVKIRGQGGFVTFLAGQSHNARGQRTSLELGNHTTTTYTYDEQTSRLLNLHTRLDGNDKILQDLNYTFDPVGNITNCIDDAQQTLFFDNAVIKPESAFAYDALYQLIRATGREQRGLGSDSQRRHEEIPLNTLPHPNDVTAVRNYTEEYDYDELGNIVQMRHVAVGGTWTRFYKYQDGNNRLLSSSEPGDSPLGPYTAVYLHDDHGNMSRMPHLTSLAWNFMDQLKEVDLEGGGKAFYVYGSNGQRIRKVIERNGVVKEERIYLGAVEVYREFELGAKALQRETLHLTDGNHRLAQVDTKTIDTAAPLSVNQHLIRYQYGNHLGSATLELDEHAALIFYEEYQPFGTTAYRSGKAGAQVSLRRYRYTGRERDAETGLYYHGARYYASWLGRWTSADPGGFIDGLNLFRYARNNPVVLSDPTGYNPPQNVQWIVPREITTVEGFQQWATRAGIQYSGTPSYNPQSHVWTVEHWTRLDPGLGGPAQPPNPVVPPASGQMGHVAPYNQQPPAQYGTPGVPSTRLTENEHIMPHAQLRDMTTNPETGQPGYSDQHYGRDATLRAPRGQALDKTYGNRGGPTADNPRTLDIQARAQRGEPVPYRQGIFEPSRQQAVRVGMPEPAVNRAILEQEGNLFGMVRGRVTDRLPQQSFGQRVASVARTLGNRIRGGDWGRPTTVGVITGVGGALARSLIPGFVEAEIGIQAAGFYALGSGAGSVPVLGTVATAAAAAPGAVAGTVLASGVAGYMFGDAVESVVTEATGSRAAGVGAGTLAGAAVGAAIGATIGSIVPVLGTAAGAIIGGAVGAIAGFIGAYW